MVKVGIMSGKRILIIEDDADAADVLSAYLTRENYAISVAGDGMTGLEMSQYLKPDLILLDVMLPGMNGTEVLAALRRRGNTPVIMVTAIGDIPERIGALRYGADDYVVKPYSPGEVVARVHAVLRRVTQASESSLLRWHGLEVDKAIMTAGVRDDNGEITALALTPTEFSLLATMMQAPMRPFSRTHLLEHCLPESDALERSVDTHVYNLRKKLEVAGINGVLINVRGIGYRFSQP